MLDAVKADLVQSDDLLRLITARLADSIRWASMIAVPAGLPGGRGGKCG